METKGNKQRQNNKQRDQPDEKKKKGKRMKKQTVVPHAQAMRHTLENNKVEK